MGLRGPTVASFRRNIVRVVWWIGIVWSSAAVAQETEADNAAEVALGEHNRLSVELQTLAQRGAWAGVERTFLRLVSTGIEPDFDDWVVGAASARARGDMKATKLRLYEASKLGEDRTVSDGLWELRQNYADVSLRCSSRLLKKKDPPSLEVEVMPFDPVQVAAIAYAKASISEDCTFDGLLPRGTYSFMDRSFTVRPNIETVSLDLRGVR